MLNVALTGNIAAGKSTVVGFFRRWGATIIDADELAREAEAPGSEVLATIVRRFGADVLGADGALDRAALRSKVMGDDGALADLNAIVHPAVQRRRRDLQREAQRRGALGGGAAARVLATGDAKDDPPALAAVATRYSEAGVRVERAAGKTALGKAAALHPQATLATARAADAARDAWQRAGRPGALVYLTDDPDPIAVRLDLRPWGGERLALTEEGATGLAPRADLFRAANPLA